MLALPNQSMSAINTITTSSRQSSAEGQLRSLSTEKIEPGRDMSILQRFFVPFLVLAFVYRSLGVQGRVWWISVVLFLAIPFHITFLFSRYFLSLLASVAMSTQYDDIP